MTQEFILDFGREALQTTILVSAPMLGFGLVIGVIVSIFQAVTSIQEMTLTFIPIQNLPLYSRRSFRQRPLQSLVG